MKLKKRTFWINVVGIQYENKDGSSRKKYLLKLTNSDTIKLIREPDNPYDQNAIKLVYGDNFQIGYIPMDKSKIIAPYLDQEYEYNVESFQIEREDIGYKLSCGIKLRIGSD